MKIREIKLAALASLGIVLLASYFIFVGHLRNTMSVYGMIASSSIIRLPETDSKLKSGHYFWWLNSGGYVTLEGNIIKTLEGELPKSDDTRKAYWKSDPGETDNGYHPQNIFRLVSKPKFKDSVQSMYFKINRYHLSGDFNRAESNGVLFMSRYKDGNNLYYAGIRVDGHAVIKKKAGGVYHTMAYEPVFTGQIYNRDRKPNLLPVDKWVGIKSEVKNLDANTVSIKLYLDKEKTGAWKLAAQAIDYNAGSFAESGNIGIRTDFMDAEFQDYTVGMSN